MKANNKNEMYIVTAYRHGEQKNHSYNLGIFTKKHKAIECAKSHSDYRGGKYACVVEKSMPNEFDNNADKYMTEVFRTKSTMCQL